MLAASVAFLGALVYGSADFLGGLAARRLRPLLVTAVAAFSGLLVLALAFPVLGGVWRAEDVAWGAASGIAGAVAVGLLYACLAIGPMSVLSPLTAVVSAVAPMLWGLLVEGERLAPIGYVGLVVAVVAIVLVAFLPGERITRPSLKAVVMAVGSGVAIGAFLVLLDRTSADSGVVPLLVNRAVAGTIASVVVLGAVAVAVRRGRAAASVLTSAENSSPARRAWLLAVVCGCVDATANLLLVIALRSGGDLAVIAALTALYPAGTVLLAAVVLREHIARVQSVGLALALTAGVLLAVS